MSSGNRREREKEQMKELILSAAKEIVTSEGFEKLSVRKIASRIEYSPAIIYHYFADKDEIVNHLMQQGYGRILSAVSAAYTNIGSADHKLMETMRNYIAEALKMPDEFIAVHVNGSPQALLHTSSLYKGASTKNAALSVLYQCIREINEKDSNGAGIAEDDHSIEMTAQLMVVSTVGFVIKLIKEKDIGKEQKQSLIEYYCNEMVPRMAKMK